MNCTNRFLEAIYSRPGTLSSMLARCTDYDAPHLNEALSVVLHDDRMDSHERLEIAENLLMYGANPNLRGSYNEPLLVATIRSRDIVTTELLLRYGSDVTVKCLEKRTPLHEAAILCSKSLIGTLIENGASTNAVDSAGCTPLMLALQSLSHNFVLSESECKEVVAILTLDYWDINKTDKNGRTPMMHASACQNPILVSLLLERGASVLHTTMDGFTCLHVAIENSARDVAELLLQHGPAHPTQSRRPVCVEDMEKMDSVDPDYMRLNLSPIQSQLSPFGSPLHYAVELAQNSIVEMLVTNLCDLDQRRKDGSTALALALRTGNLFAMRILIQHNCNIHIYSDEFDSTVFCAILTGQFLAVKLLMIAGCEVTLGNLNSLSVGTLNQLLSIRSYDDDDQEELLDRETAVLRLNSARSLRALCRNTVRSHLSKELPFKQQLAKLEIPKVMKEFLALKELNELDLSKEQVQFSGH